MKKIVKIGYSPFEFESLLYYQEPDSVTMWDDVKRKYYPYMRKYSRLFLKLVNSKKTGSDDIKVKITIEQMRNYPQKVSRTSLKSVGIKG